MREVRIFVGAAMPASGALLLQGQAARHVAKVLRMKPGQPLTVFDGRGNEYPAEIKQVTASQVTLQIGEGRRPQRESALHSTVAMAMIRGERMDLMVQKATELGASEIVPLQCERSVTRLPPGRAEKRAQHWQGVAISACEQCGRNQLPIIQPVIDFSTWLEGLGQPADTELRLVGDPQGQRSFSAQGQVSKVVMLTGPEGGLSEREKAAAMASQFEPVLMGPRVLRAETAAITLLAVVQWQLGDLRTH